MPNSSDQSSLNIIPKLPLTLAVVTLNEEKSLRRCLQSVPFAAEILVVDSGSTDATIEVAKSMSAKVISEKWRGYGKQKQFAAEQASHDWVLFLDADEALSPELCLEIQNRFASLDNQTGYEFSRISFHLGRWIRHGGWYPDRQLRLYNRKFSRFSEAELHERVVSKRVEWIKENIQHWVFEDLSDNVVTNDKYSSLGALEYHRQGKKFSVLSLVFRPFGKFLECYFFKLGVLDGLAGFVIAIGASYSLFLRYAKLWELEKLNAKKNRS